ncbi:tubulin-like doman-containing protein [Verrucomicrobia bacterium]|nr:tubulin-like doman-containing protein [Verrucomicrobiota bacterium]
MSSNIEAKEYPCLLIGMGGTGVKVLQKLKTQFLQKTPGLIAENGGSVMFLGIDTEPFERSVKHRPLKQGEYEPIGLDTNPKRFVENNLKADGNFGIKTVWPEVDGQPYILNHSAPITMGASQNRLIGRTALFISAKDVFSKIRKTIDDFFRMEKVSEDDFLVPQVHIISSIAGGTGSSLIFDVPYLVKLAAKAADRHVYQTGHFVMAGAFQGVLKGSEQQMRTKANTYTCLRELDNLYRKHAENQAGQGQPLWEVRYNAVTGTIDDVGDPKDIALEVPMDWINIYHNQNEENIGITKPDAMYDIISQAISYSINGGINGKMLSANDNIKQKISNLSSTHKAKPYSTLGVSTLELPLEGLQKYLAYSWAEQLTRKKADHPYQQPEHQGREGEEIWHLMQQWELEPLQKIVIQSCPLFRTNPASGKWEEVEGEKEIRQNWPRLAEEFGLSKFKHNFQPDINEHIDKFYDRRLVDGKKFYDKAQIAFDKYRDQVKANQKEQVSKVRKALNDELASLINYKHSLTSDSHEEAILRSTDAFSEAVDDLQRALGRIIVEVSAEQQKLESKQSAAERNANPEGALRESKVSVLGFGGRSGQISDWSEAVKLAITSKAGAEQARLLKAALEELREYLGEEIKLKVDKADSEMTRYVQEAKGKAENIKSEAKRDEREKAVSVFLIRADQFPAFAATKLPNLEQRAEAIWQKTDQLIREKIKKGSNSLIETLAVGRKHLILGDADLEAVSGCLEEACLEAAREELGNLNFQQFVNDEFLDVGKKEDFRKLLVELDRKAAPWLTADKEFQAANFTDEIECLDYLLYPSGAEDVATVLENFVERGDFREDPDIVKMPEGVTEGIVRVSMRFGYTLESLDFMNAFKECEKSMVANAPKIRRSILKDYEDTLCPLDESSGQRTIINLTTKDYTKFAHTFIRSHYYGLIEQQIEAGEARWVYIKEDEYTGRKAIDIPSKSHKVNFAAPVNTAASDMDFEILKGVYRDARNDPKSILRVAAIMEDEYKESLIHKEREFRQACAQDPDLKALSPVELDRRMFAEYAEKKVKEIGYAKRPAAKIEEEFLNAVIRSELAR